MGTTLALGMSIPNSFTPAECAARPESRFLSRMARRLDAHPGILLLLLLAAYSAVTLRVITAKPLWHDEIFTVAIDRLPSMTGVWQALRSGLEQMPPLAHVISRAAYRLGGSSAASVRIPSAIGFALLCVCLYAVLRRRLPAVYALAGAAVPFLTQALHFAYEARPYGIALGMTGLAVLCWDMAGDSRRRPFAIAGLALACAIAVANHYFAAVIVFPLALGEIVRTVESRKFDPAVWAALAAPAVPLLLFLPLIRAARSYAKVFWARPHASMLQDAYAYLTGLGAPLFVGLAIIWLLYLAFVRERRRVVQRRVFQPLIAVGAGFLMLPAISVAAAYITGAFTPRYAIWAIVGLALGIPYIACLTTSGSRRFGWVIAVYLTVAALGIQFAAWRRWQGAGGKPESLATATKLAETGLPVVYDDPVAYLQLAWYAPQSLNRQLYYLADPAAALRYAGTDSAERALVLLAGLTPLHIAQPAAFTAGHSRFLLVDEGELSWLVPKLVASGATLIVRDASPSTHVYEVLTGGEPSPQVGTKPSAASNNGDSVRLQLGPGAGVPVPDPNASVRQ